MAEETNMMGDGGEIEDVPQMSPAAEPTSTKKPRINQFFKTVASVGASDLHIKSDAIPRVRIGGDLKTLKTAALSPEEVDAIVHEMLSDEQRHDFHQHG